MTPLNSCMIIPLFVKRMSFYSFLHLACISPLCLFCSFTIYSYCFLISSVASLSFFIVWTPTIYLSTVSIYLGKEKQHHLCFFQIPHTIYVFMYHNKGRSAVTLLKSHRRLQVWCVDTAWETVLFPFSTYSQCDVFEFDLSIAFQSITIF